MIPYIILCFIALGCRSDKLNTEEVITKSAEWFVNEDFPYNLKKPTVELKMPVVLREISGLCYIKEKNALGAINDELGNIYLLNPKTSKIVEKIKFSEIWRL